MAVEEEYSNLVSGRSDVGPLVLGSCRHRFRQAIEVYLIRRLPIQAPVWAFVVVELDVAADPAAAFAD